MGQTQEPLVSICCITYNHEDYIRDTIESFLMQETDFQFEIVIHDDACTDRTAEIIREYEKRYPDIIKPIYQTENQYSRSGNSCILPTIFTFKAARGKYLALCEGDDYWIDPLKLQKQITEMAKHPECYISFHPAIMRWEGENGEDEVLGLHSDKTTIFPIEEVISWWGVFMPTASIVIHRLAIPRIISFFSIARDAPVGDYYIQVLGAENGGALYLNDVMSVYRYMVPGSWTEDIKEDSSRQGSWLRLSIQTHDKLNAFTDHKYSELFDTRKKRYYSHVIRLPFLDITIKENIIDANFDNIDIRDRILWDTVYKRPSIVNILLGMRRFVANRQS